MDPVRFDTAVSRFSTHLARRRSLAMLGALGLASMGLIAEADAKKHRKTRPRRCSKVGYAFCVDGETTIVDSCGRKKLLKRGETPGRCPDTCVPQCMDCTDGADGCGGTCSCPDGQACVDGTCKASR